jgi:hypothetical protein
MEDVERDDDNVFFDLVDVRKVEGKKIRCFFSSSRHDD